MTHTHLTPKTWGAFTVTIFFTGLLSVGYGAIDLIMIAPKGISSVAAVGLGDIFSGALTALLGFGIIDSIIARLAIDEGSGRIGERMTTLLIAMGLLLIPTTAIGIGAAIGVPPLLTFSGESPTVTILTSHYVWVKMLGIPATIVFATLTETLKLCGLKSRSLLLLILGFGANALLNGIVLYTPFGTAFPSPVAGVASTTAIVQVLTSAAAGIILYRALRARGISLHRTSPSVVFREVQSIGKAAPGIGLRHFNDNIGTIAITLFIGSFGVEMLAAMTVATKIWSLYCRVPQACVSGTFVFYAYEVGRAGELPTQSNLRHVSKTLFRYALIPTYFGALAVALTAPLLVTLFTSQQLDKTLTCQLLWAFLLTTPAYLLENNYGEMLTVRGNGALLAIASTITTYLISIPLAAIGTYWIGSPFFVILAEGAASLVLALVFRQALHRYDRDPKTTRRMTA